MGPIFSYHFVRYRREFVVTVIVITAFDSILKRKRSGVDAVNVSNIKGKDCSNQTWMLSRACLFSPNIFLFKKSRTRSKRKDKEMRNKVLGRRELNCQLDLSFPLDENIKTSSSSPCNKVSINNLKNIIKAH